MAGDSPLPPYPGNWIHVSFANGKLYADVWQGNDLWVAATYTVRNGKLVALDRLRHKRPVRSNFEELKA